MTKSGSPTHILLLTLSLILLDRVSSNCWMEGNNTAAFHHNQRCEAALADERNQAQTFYTTVAAFVTALVSGSISAISSIVIICLIYRSDVGLSSVYHRVILAMSVSDIIASTCMGLSTMLMPKDMIYKQFAGWVWGNKTTCTIQGFLIQIFVPLSAFFNALLSLYYVFAINLKKRDAILKKSKLFNIVFPVIGIILSAFVPVSALFVGNMVNPTPYDAWCNLETYPRYCNGMNEEKCVPSSLWEEWILKNFQAVVTGTFNVVLFASLVLVVIGVYRQERYIKLLYKLLYPHRRLGGSEAIKLASTKKRQTYTKALTIQSAAYLISFLLCSASGAAHVNQHPSQGWGLQIYHVSFRPLQGIFNLIIFVGHKAYDNKLMNRSLTVRQAVVQVFQEREKVKFLLSNVSLVRDDDLRSFYFDGEDDEGEEDISHAIEDHDDSPIIMGEQQHEEEQGITSSERGEDMVFHEDAGASEPVSSTREQDKSTSESIGIDSRFSLSGSWESRWTGSQALSALLSLAPSVVSSTGLEQQQGNQDSRRAER